MTTHDLFIQYIKFSRFRTETSDREAIEPETEQSTETQSSQDASQWHYLANKNHALLSLRTIGLTGMRLIQEKEQGCSSLNAGCDYFLPIH